MEESQNALESFIYDIQEKIDLEYEAEQQDKADKQTMADIGYEGSLEEWQALTDEDRAAKVQGAADAAAAAEATAKEEAAAATKADADARTHGVASAADPAAMRAEWSRSGFAGDLTDWRGLPPEERKRILAG